MNSASVSPVETVLRDELARADRALGGVSPVLQHMLTTSGDTLINDAIVARVRGTLNDVAQQLVERVPDASDAIDEVVEQLAADTSVLAFVHSAAMEAMIAERLEQSAGVDPVLSPLWQELIASTEAQTSETAMLALASQSRFMQAQRRMQCPLAELPAEVLERVLRVFARVLPVDQEPEVTVAMRAIKADFDEAASRTGLLARLVGAMREGRIAALELEHAGLALFVSALAHATPQSRERSVLACHTQQSARLALGLRAAGLEADAIERQLLLLESGAGLPPGLTNLSAELAKSMLRQSSSRLREADAL